MDKILKIIGICMVFLITGSCEENTKEGQIGKRSEKKEDTYKEFTTYCNPLDIDYSYMSHYRARNNVSYRSGADPAVVNFKGRFYMFVTRSHGYWASDDMSNWKFIKPQS